MTNELYASTDVEANGPIPGVYSMLSFGTCLFDSSGTELGSFYSNLELLPDAAEHPETADFWKEHQTAYNMTRHGLEQPSEVMHKYVEWLDQFDAPKVFVAYPVGFDFTFVYWYLHKFVGISPFYHSAVDIRSYGMALMGSYFMRSTKKFFPNYWKPANAPHTHNALLDAREQGLLFCNMLKHRREKMEPFKKVKDERST